MAAAQLGCAHGRGRSRVGCVLTAADGRDVTATIAADDYPDLRRNSLRSNEWSASAHYHDLTVSVSVLIEEQIIAWLQHVTRAGPLPVETR